MKKVAMAFAITAMISGCGTTAVNAAAPVWGVDGLFAISTGAEIPASPSMLKLNGQWLVAYDSCKPGDDSVYLASSSDAIHWTSHKLFSGQEPFLFEMQGKAAIAYADDWQLRVATFDGGNWTSGPLEGLQDATTPSVTRLQEGGYAISYSTLAGGCYVAKTQDAKQVQSNVLIAEEGYAPSIAQAEDGTLAVAYENGKGISLATEAQGKWSSQVLVSDRGALSPCLVGGKAFSLYFAKTVEGHRAIAKLSNNQEELVINNGMENLQPAVLLQDDEESIAVGIKNSVGARGVFFAKKP